MDKQAHSPSQSKPTDHMANERTFLAWVRTSVGIMAFGFVVERFALFIKQITLYFSTQAAAGPALSSAHQKYTSSFGIFLVALGALMGLFSFLSYRKVEKQLKENKYHPSAALPAILTVLVIVMGIFLVVYLISP
jgi:putative membrane protein